MSTTAPIVATSTVTQLAQDAPPLARILPYLLAAPSFIWAIISKVTYGVVTLTSYASAPVIHLAKIPLPAILYILSPLIVFCQIIVGVFFLVPYNAIVGFFVAIQPVYVFCGVACITGAVIGLGGRGVAGVLSAIVLGPDYMDSDAPPPVEALDEKPKKWVDS